MALYEEIIAKSKKKKEEKIALPKQSTPTIPKYSNSFQNSAQQRLDYLTENQKERSKTDNQLGTMVSNVLQKPKNWEDGYQFGDITKTVLGTSADIGLNLLDGIWNVSESITDAGRYGIAQVADWLGQDEFANRQREIAKQDTLTNFLKPVVDTVDKSSITGKTTDQVSQGVGYVLGTLGSGEILGKLKLPTSIKAGKFSLPTTSIISGMSGGMTEAYNNGASNAEAWTYGALSGLTESFSEAMFGGLGKTFTKKFGGGALDDVFVNKLTSKIGNKTFKALAQTGLKATGEGVEEVVSGLGNAFAKKLTYMQEEDIGKLIENENLLEEFVMGTITSAITQAPSTFANANRKATISQSTQESIRKQLEQQVLGTDNNIAKTQNKKNSATVFDAKIPKLTSETNNGTSSSRTNIPGLQLPNNISSSVDNNTTNSTESQIAPLSSQNNMQEIENLTSYNMQERKDFNNIKMVPTQDIMKLYDGGGSRTSLETNLLLESIQENGIKKPIFVSKETGKIVNGNHRLYVANQLGMKNVPVKYVDSSSDVDLGDEEWYNLVGDRLNEERRKTSTVDERMQYESIDNNRSNETINRTSNSGQSDKLYSGIQENNDGSSVETIYGGGTSLGRGLENSSFSLPLNNNQETKNDTIKFPKSNKTMNPIEISNLTKEDASTTPKLPKYDAVSGNEESSFYENVTETSEFLNEGVRKLLSNEDDIKYYESITNEETLEKAYKKLQDGGQREVLNWFERNGYDENGKFKYKPTAIDVAEGWILLKQYQDAEDYDSVITVAKKMREIGTQAGQTVQAFNILARLTPEGMIKYAQSELTEAFEKMSKNKTKEWIDSNRDKFDLNAQEVQFIVETMKEVQGMPDGYEKRVKLAEIQKLMTDKLPPEKGAGIKSWMRISMLFNPKTQVRNVAGNALIAPVNYFSDLFASVVDKQISKKTGYRTLGTTNIKSYVDGFKKGAFESYNDFKKGINTRNIQGNRFEIGQGKSFNNDTTIGKSLNRVDSLLSFMLDAGDRMFYEATFTNSINNQLVLNNTDVVTQEMIDIATQEALSRTWQDNNNYTKFVLNIRKGLNAIHIHGKEGYGLGDILIPFAKTPANLTKAIIDYSPVGLVQTAITGMNLKRSLSNGQYNQQLQHEFVQNLGKATAGTMLYVLGYALAKSGIASGESDEDKDVSNFLKNTLGVSSYSIKIGDKSFTYDWAQPVAAPIAMMTNLVQKQKENKNLVENITAVLDTGLNVIFEQSFLESLSNVLSESGEIGTKLGEQFLELPSRAIPTFSKQIADLIDGTQRTTFEKDKPLETAVNKVKAKIPGLSKTLAPTVDTMGREIQKYGGKNNLFNVFINPANVNAENISKSAKEIYRIYKETSDTTIMPRMAPYYINNSGEKIILDSKKRAEYQKISGEIIEQAVQELLTKKNYKNMNDIEKASIINKIVNYSYNKAKEEVLEIEMSNEYNKINQYVEDGGKVADYYLNKEEVDFSYNNPEKYAVISQITSYDKYTTYKEKIDNIRDKTTNDKTATINYINSLSLSIPQKAMFIKMYYPSFDGYNKQIISYVNSQKITKTEKETILKKLGFTVKDGRVY